ncbi:hypothetical protein ABZP36_004321 [Zizania latifolia]
MWARSTSPSDGGEDYGDDDAESSSTSQQDGRKENGIKSSSRSRKKAIALSLVESLEKFVAATSAETSST